MEIFPPTDHDSFRALSSALDATEDELEQAFASITPTEPLPPIERLSVAPRKSARASWEPPPLRKLLESAPPPPRPVMRSQLEVEHALASGVSLYDVMMTAKAPSPQAIELAWDDVPQQATALSRRGTWIAVGVAYVMGATTVYAMDQPPQPKLTRATPVFAGHALDAPAAFVPAVDRLSRGTPIEPIVEIDPIATMEPLHIVGYLTDPPARPSATTAAPLVAAPQLPTPREALDLGRLRVIVAAMAASAAGCGDGSQSGSARVAITFAPTGRATSAVIQGGAFAGTRAGSCIANIMRQAKVPAFKGRHVTVNKTVRIRGDKTP